MTLCRQYLKTFRWAVFSLLTAMNGFLLAAANTQTSLDFKAIHHAQIGVETSTFGLSVSDSHLFSLPQYSDFFIQYPYVASKPSSSEAFSMGNRDTAPGQRIRFPESIGMKFWKGVLAWDGYLWFLDAAGPKVVSYQIQEKRWSRPRDIVIDLLRPAADSRGEPTSTEIQSLRQQFRRSYKSLTKDLPQVYGWTRLDKKSTGRFSNNEFLMLSRIKGFPLLAMSCKNPRKPYCEVKRSCNLALPKGVDQESIAGIAFSHKRRILLIGNFKSNEIYLYQAKSCYHLPLRKRLKLPKELHQLASLYIDGQDNLWVGTSEPDSYLNASTYRWNATDW